MDSVFDDLSRWNFLRCEYDSSSKTVRIDADEDNPHMSSRRIPLAPGYYVLTVEYRSDAWPWSGIRLGSRIHEASLSKGGGGNNSAYPIPGEWTQVILPIHLDDNAQQVHGTIVRAPSPLQGPIEIRNPKLYTDQEFPWDTYPKEKFDERGMVAVTDKGLFTIRGKPFVPIGVMVDKSRPSFDVYSSNGFNVNMWCGGLNEAQKTVDAGMYFMLSVSPYIHPSGWAYNNINGMLNSFGEILGHSRLADYCIGFYYDHEAFEEHSVLFNAISALRKMDTRLPIYSLQGNYNVAPMFSEHNLHDITGTYMRSETYGQASPGAGGAKVLNHLVYQTASVTFAQLNGDFRRDELLDDAGINCTALSYWGDGQRDLGPIEDKSFWPGFKDWAQEFSRLVIERAKSGPVIEPPPPPTDLDVSLSHFAMSLNPSAASSIGLVSFNIGNETLVYDLDIKMTERK